VKALYESYVANPSDINEHLTFIHDLVIELNAQQVVELGVRSGVSTAAFLAALEETGGRLWSCDIAHHNAPVIIADHPQWEFHIGDDLQLAAESPLCDVLFIDTSHAYKQTVDELNAYAGKARVVLLHDTTLEQPGGVGEQPPFPVRQACLDWLEAHPGWDWHEFTHNNGLGVMRRKP
jgi:predicted O-methyltransferase YrrM